MHQWQAEERRTHELDTVGAYALLIAPNEHEADAIKAAIAPGRCFACYDTAQLAATFERIFAATAAGQ